MKEVLCKVVLKNKHPDLAVNPTLTKNKLNLVTTATILKLALIVSRPLSNFHCGKIDTMLEFKSQKTAKGQVFMAVTPDRLNN